MKKSIIFDLDGTLWDSTKEIKKVWLEIASKYIHKIESVEIENIMGMTNDEIIRYLFDGNYEFGNEFLAKCQNEENIYLRKNGGKIYKNTKEVIKSLSRDYELYIVSNCQKGYIEAFLEYYALYDYFKDFECSGNTGLNKSQNINLILKRNNIVNAIYVGDTENDYIAARQNNLNFVWAQYGFGNCESYYKKIGDIKELINIM